MWKKPNISKYKNREEFYIDKPYDENNKGTYRKKILNFQANI